MSARSSLAGYARLPSASSRRDSARLTGAPPASDERRRHGAAALVDQPLAFAARIRGRGHLAGGEIPGDDFHVAPAAAALLQLVAHGLKARDVLIRERALLVLDGVGQVLMMVAGIRDDIRSAHAVQVIERSEDHHADDGRTAAAAYDQQGFQ